MKLCPSQFEEMVPLGTLCYSNIRINRADLEQAILHHPSWKPEDPNDPPIFDLYIGDFLASHKKTKMLFISAEKSEVPQLTMFFKSLYDGKPKSYPNGTMMVFIPLNDGTLSSAEYRSKIIYNHKQTLGDQMALSIGGLQNLNNMIQLKSLNQQISLQSLLKNFPATKGMSSPVLFQHVESNFSNTITMVVFQKADHSFIIDRQSSLESEIRSLLAEDEEPKVFLNAQDGIWFGGIHKNQGGQFQASVAPTKSGAQYADHVKSLMKSPPKKRLVPLSTPMKNQSQLKPSAPPTHPSTVPIQPSPLAPSTNHINDMRFLQFRRLFQSNTTSTKNLTSVLVTWKPPLTELTLTSTAFLTSSSKTSPINLQDLTTQCTATLRTFPPSSIITQIQGNVNNAPISIYLDAAPAIPYQWPRLSKPKKDTEKTKILQKQDYAAKCDKNCNLQSQRKRNNNRKSNTKNNPICHITNQHSIPVHPLNHPITLSISPSHIKHIQRTYFSTPTNPDKKNLIFDE
jgi:hypothetical protein